MSYITNSMHNRKQALKLFKAGFTGKEIAREFSLIWKCNKNGKIGQKYSYTLPDGRKEIDTMMSSSHVNELIENKLK